MTEPTRCAQCGHYPSLRLNIQPTIIDAPPGLFDNGIQVEKVAVFEECHCPCHDAADAGPELLAACKGIETVYAEYIALRPDPNTKAFDFVSDAVKSAREAIAKAEPKP